MAELEYVHRTLNLNFLVLIMIKLKSFNPITHMRGGVKLTNTVFFSISWSSGSTEVTEIAKLSPSHSSIGAELALFSADPTTHPPGKVFFSAPAN